VSRPSEGGCPVGRVGASSYLYATPHLVVCAFRECDSSKRCDLVSPPSQLILVVCVFYLVAALECQSGECSLSWHPAAGVANYYNGPATPSTSSGELL